MYCHLPDQDTPKTFLIDPTIKDEIEENWQLFTERRPTKEIATLCRFIKADGEKITIATDVTYKDVVGLRWGNLVTNDRALFKVVTAMAIVKTSDNCVVLIPRDSGDWEPSLECPGGFIRSTCVQNNKISITDFIRQRTCDDLNISTEQIDSCSYTTTYDAVEILEHMLLYKITLTLTKEEIETQHPSFVLVPPEYSPSTHHLYSEEPLHVPSSNAISIVANLQNTTTLIS